MLRLNDKNREAANDKKRAYCADKPEDTYTRSYVTPSSNYLRGVFRWREVLTLFFRHSFPRAQIGCRVCSGCQPCDGKEPCRSCCRKGTQQSGQALAVRYQ